MSGDGTERPTRRHENDFANVHVLDLDESAEINVAAINDGGLQVS